MSLQDLNSQFQSDESDNEGEKLWSDQDDSNEVDYLDLLCLHDNLLNFENIYLNNAIIDMQHHLESEAGPTFDDVSIESELALSEDYVNSFQVLSSRSSLSSPEAVLTPNTEDSENSTVSLLQDLEDFLQVLQDVLSSFSSSSSDSGVSDVQETDWDDIN